MHSCGRCRSTHTSLTQSLSHNLSLSLNASHPPPPHLPQASTKLLERYGGVLSDAVQPLKVVTALNLQVSLPSPFCIYAR